MHNCGENYGNQSNMKLLTLGSSVTKLKKSDQAGKGYLSAILYLSPHLSGGRGNLCPNASQGCILSCLYTAGRGRMSNVKKARRRKTRLFFDNRPKFVELLRKDLQSFSERCKRKQQMPAVRLNGTSDIPIEKMFPWVFTEFPHIQFYDYTKSFLRMTKFIKGQMPKNYHLTFSRSETNDEQAKQILDMGGNVAYVFHQVPKTYIGKKVENADETDLRFLDKRGVLLGLKAKGLAKKDLTGFVI